MGLIKAIAGAVGGVAADQWKEYFYADAFPANVLAAQGMKKTSSRSSNTKGTENIITNGSIVVVADGQCMMIVDQGKVTEFCAEPGEYVYDTSTEPSIFVGPLGESILKVFANIGKRFTFGGEAPKDQRVYYFNLKELVGNKYGTPSPVPFRVVDKNIGLDMDISIRCYGEFSYKISNPMLFYTNICGNITQNYTRDQIDGQLRSEVMTALQPAFAKISAMGIRYSALPAHTAEIADALNEVLSEKWHDLRGLEIVSFGISSLNASEEDENMIKEMQKSAVFRDPAMAAAHLTQAQAAAMQNAASNENAGPALAFMGMHMAGNAGGINAQKLFEMSQQQKQDQTSDEAIDTLEGEKRKTQPSSWDCSCGQKGNTGNFCINCGAKRPNTNSWTCPSCGQENTGKFCSNCGAKKPAGVPQYRCDKCGWQPEDPIHPPKFCPNCGDPFGDEDQL